MTKNAISYYLRKVITEAHATFDEEMEGQLRVKAHEIRAVATSIRYTKNLSVKDLIEAAFWRCRSVFASHYLKDVAIVYEKCCALGPIVSAGEPVA